MNYMSFTVSMSLGIVMLNSYGATHNFGCEFLLIHVDH